MKNSVWEGGCPGGRCGLQQLGHLLGSSCPCAQAAREQFILLGFLWVGLVFCFVLSKQYIFKTKIKATWEMKWPALLLPGREPACVPAHGPTPSPEALGWGRGDTGGVGGMAE